LAQLTPDSSSCILFLFLFIGLKNQQSPANVDPFDFRSLTNRNKALFHGHVSLPPMADEVLEGVALKAIDNVETEDDNLTKYKIPTQLPCGQNLRLNGFIFLLCKISRRYHHAIVLFPRPIVGILSNLFPLVMSHLTFIRRKLGNKTNMATSTLK
jgi:hypothetical protein